MPDRILRKRRPRQPFGMLSGLLAASLTTLIGICSGLEPFTILCRAMVSGIAIGLTVSIGISVIKVANIPNETKANQ